MFSEDVILNYFATTAGFEEGEVTVDTKIVDLGLDSIDVADIIMFLEDETEVVVKEDEWAAFVTVGDVINHLKS